ncbi:hypothetical protein L9F63_007983 [Diploptera punctata]|uniref:Uncharacterized protein n=1 Tax=Diploptera punctata TaxID=6984 RepID=A0AAD8E2H4_DIPPU|nr:hypothetical protein L9F63_007983 [Diploptera punctata]
MATSELSSTPEVEQLESNPLLERWPWARMTGRGAVTLFARGIITSVTNNEFLARSEVSTRVTKVYRQIHPVFKPQNLSAFEYSILEQEQNILKDLSIVTNTVMDSRMSTSYSPRYQYGTIYVPLHCGAKHGPGEFIFMGRFVLDDPVLTCAPRLEDWLQIQRRAIREDNAQCSLET